MTHCANDKQINVLINNEYAQQIDLYNTYTFYYISSVSITNLDTQYQCWYAERFNEKMLMNFCSRISLVCLCLRNYRRFQYMNHYFTVEQQLTTLVVIFYVYLFNVQHLISYSKQCRVCCAWCAQLQFSLLLFVCMCDKMTIKQQVKKKNCEGQETSCK